MRQPIFARNFALITLIVMGFILYGSLFPFAFHRMPPGALHALLVTWKERPGRGDGLANILLYVPLGYFALLTLRPALGAGLAAGLAALLGVGLCVGIELTQYYDAGRVTTMSDVYANTAGTLLGVGAAAWLGGERWRTLRWRGDPAPVLLLAAWAGYNLFPFAPVIDLHKYWSAIKPLLHPSLSLYTLFTHVAVWVAAAALIDEVMHGKRSLKWFALFAAILLGAKIVIMENTLSVAEATGAAGGWIWLAALANRPRLRPPSAALLLGGAILALRLEPFHFQGPPHVFGWIPFYSFMYGSLQVDALSFLEKGFQYGSLIWLLQKNGAPLAAATSGVAAALLATSLMEIYLPGRSAEITDAAMALITGGVIALVRPPGAAPSTPAPPEHPRHA